MATFQTFRLVRLQEINLYQRGSGQGVRKGDEIAGMTLRANVFLSPGARSHPETESHSTGETAFVSSVPSRCRPALTKPPAPAVSVPRPLPETPLWFKGSSGRCLPLKKSYSLAPSVVLSRAFSPHGKNIAQCLLKPRKTAVLSLYQKDSDGIRCQAVHFDSQTGEIVMKLYIYLIFTDYPKCVSSFKLKM